MLSHTDLIQNLEKLRSFAVVARCGGFHKASRELGVSQPGLSRSIDALESVIGKKLLARSVRGVKLTENGKLVLALYEKIESSVVDVTQKINSGNLPLSGEIRVASYETLCTYFWPLFLKLFGKKYPDLRVNLITDNESEHWHKLVSGSIDAIVDAEPKQGPQWESYPLYTDKFNFFAANSYEQKNKMMDLISVEKARDQEGLSIRDHCIKAGIGFQETYKLDTFVSVKAFTLQGLGVGVIPEGLVQQELGDGKLDRIHVKGIPGNGFGKHRICLSISKDGLHDLRLSLLRKELRSHFSEIK